MTGRKKGSGKQGGSGTSEKLPDGKHGGDLGASASTGSSGSDLGTSAGTAGDGGVAASGGDAGGIPATGGDVGSRSGGIGRDLGSRGPPRHKG